MKNKIMDIAHQDTEVKEGKSLYETVTFWAMAVTALLLPIFILPISNISFLYAKFGLVTLTVVVAAVTSILQVLNDRKIERYSILNYALIFALPVVYIVSSFFSAPAGMSLMGSGSDIDTSFFFFLGSVLVYLFSRVFRAKPAVFMLTLGLVSVSSVIALFHLLRFAFGASFLSMGVFNALPANTIGGLNDLAVYAGLGVLLSMLALELVTIKKPVKIALVIALALSLGLLCVTNFNLQNSILGLPFGFSVSAIIAFFSLVLFIHKKVTSVTSKLPVVSLSVLLVSLVFTIAISPISSFLLPKIGITQNDTLDVRVSPLASAHVIAETYKGDVKEAILGVGPNKHFIAWGKYKPVNPQNSVNSTPFWNVDFNSASGFIPTSFVTAGILGLVAWLFVIALMLYYVTKLLRKIAQPDRDAASVFVGWVVSVGALYLWIVALLYTPSPTMLFLAFIFTGLFLATLVREEIIFTKIVNWDVTTYWRGFAVTFGMILLIVACIYMGYAWAQRAYASIQIQKAISTLQGDATKVTDAEVLALKSINTYFNTNDLRLASEIALIRPVKLIGESQGVVQPEKLTQDIVNDISFSINAARRAAIDRGMSPDYRDWLQLGKAYEAATFLGATSTAALAVESYAQAERLNPTNPVPSYLIGRLYSFARGYDVAEEKLQRAVTLKPDYAEAVGLLNTVRSSKGNTRNAPITIPETKSATSTSSGAKGAAGNSAKSTTTPAANR